MLCRLIKYTKNECLLKVFKFFSRNFSGLDFSQFIHILAHISVNFRVLSVFAHFIGSVQYTLIIIEEIIIKVGCVKIILSQKEAQTYGRPSLCRSSMMSRA